MTPEEVQRDHPREYGENAANSSPIEAFTGPSPRIRGELQGHFPEGLRNGTIPANTGRIWGKPYSRCSPWDHPREYGENYKGPITLEVGRGPSPRIRGESPQAHIHDVALGTIPANTGRMLAGVDKVVEERDHPREYGENIRQCPSSECTRGPSPRIRGESQISKREVTFKGTIPANTGRIEEKFVSAYAAEDHPREYGENRWGMGLSLWISGPSPRIRGE